MQNKKCKKCENLFPITDFHKQKSGKYGVKAECKQCQNAYRRAHYSKPEENLRPLCSKKNISEGNRR